MESAVRYTWPEGRGCAGALTFDTDTEAAHVFRSPERAARQLADADMEAHGFGHPHRLLRIPRLLDRDRLRGTFCVPGWTIERHTAAIRSIHDAGHELGAHGTVHERLDTRGEIAERAAVPAVVTACGRRVL